MAMQVRNMKNAKGRSVVNQFIIENESKTMFQSYDSPIVEIDREKKIITVFKDYNYSRTTAKYRNQFMYGQGFRDMDTFKKFNYYMNLGAIGDFEIVKEF